MWTIHEVTNTVKISKKCAKDLFEASASEYEGTTYHDLWDNAGQVTYKGKLVFNSDHQEHMDYLSGDYSEKLLAVLMKHKVKGDIGFADLEGDGAGNFWGYRFDGKGGMKELIGQVTWTEKEE